jgi:hypothetical protein
MLPTATHCCTVCTTGVYTSLRSGQRTQKLPYAELYAESHEMFTSTAGLTPLAPVAKHQPLLAGAAEEVMQALVRMCDSPE